MIIQRNTYPVDLRANMRGGKGTVSITPLAEAERPANCRLFSRIEIPVGASIGYHVHENETELFYFLSGKGRVKDNGDPHDIAPGDTLVTPDGHGHEVVNTGDVPLVLLACIILD